MKRDSMIYTEADTQTQSVHKTVDNMLQIYAHVSITVTIPITRQNQPNHEYN